MSRTPHKQSRRVAWPEPGRPEGGEFRLTWGRLAAIVTTLAAVAGAVPIWWAISDHWMNRPEIEKAMKLHADHDSGVQAWNQYGFAANRLDYLDDKQAECDVRQALKALTPIDTALCERYKSKYKTKEREASDLKAEAMKTTKEK